MAGRVHRSKENEVVATAATVRVTAKLPGGDVKEKAKELEVEKFVTEPAYVRVGAGVTRSPVQFESIRIDVAITYPCYKEQVEEVFPRVAEMVNKYLDEEMENYGIHTGEGE